MKGKLSFVGFLVLVGFSCALTEEVLNSNTWAFLVSGGNTYDNYGQQADILHAYHIMLNKGLQKDKIITMMYDDIADNKENPYKGVVMNRPRGPNVYEGVYIDYRGKDVTPKNFLNVLAGKESEMKNIGSGKVLKSGKNDTIFLVFSGHGLQGVMLFPDDKLYAIDLIQTLHKMKEENKFGKIISYIEACYSGSIFDNLIENLNNVFVITAAAYNEVSLKWYCDAIQMGTCLGCLFSTAWMERMDEMNASETLYDSYDAVRTLVRKSHVQMYGDYKLGFLEQFTSGKELHLLSTEDTFIKKGEGVENSEMPLYMAKMKALKATGPDAKEKLKYYEQLLETRAFADKLMKRIMHRFTNGDTVLMMDLESNWYKLNFNMFDCYKRIITTFDENCFDINKNNYISKHLHQFANICIKELDEEKAINAVKTVCQESNEEIKKIYLFKWN